MRIARHDVRDRHNLGLDNAVNPALADTVFRVDLDMDRRIERLVLGRAHGGKDKPHRGHLMGVFASHDRFERRALVLGRGVIDDQLERPIAFMDRSRPFINARRAQAV